MFIGNFQGTYERPSTTETLKTIKQKYDESLRDYIKYFCNARNAIPYIQDIEIINVFRDEDNDIKTVEEIAMKNPKTVAELHMVADVCIEASEAQARLLNLAARGPRRRNRTIRKSTRLIVETAEITDTVASSPLNRRKRGHSSILPMQRSGVIFIALQVMI
jgi:hypothetical protein